MDEAKGSVNERKLLDDVFCLGNEVAAVISVLGLVMVLSLSLAKPTGSDTLFVLGTYSLNLLSVLASLALFLRTLITNRSARQVGYCCCRRWH